MINLLVPLSFVCLNNDFCITLTNKGHIKLSYYSYYFQFNCTSSLDLTLVTEMDEIWTCFSSIRFEVQVISTPCPKRKASLINIFKYSCFYVKLKVLDNRRFIVLKLFVRILWLQKQDVIVLQVIVSILSVLTKCFNSFMYLS